MKKLLLKIVLFVAVIVAYDYTWVGLYQPEKPSKIPGKK